MSTNSTNFINPDVCHDPVVQSLALLFAIFLSGAIIQFATSRVKIGLPYTVVVFVLGMLFGIPGKSDIANIEMGPHLMLNIFMPILIFEGAFAMDVFVLRKVFWQALFLAGPGLVVITGLTATVAQPLMKSDEWGWSQSLLFGSILSATDPVAVVALLKELGASPYLSLLIEGESLMNDGTAMVAFTVLYNVIIKKTVLSVEYVIVDGFLRTAVGGPVFGYLMARLCLLWLNYTFNDPLSEISATFVAAFATFFLSENFLHVSGVLALVVLGVVLSNNRTSISPEVETFLHSFWEVLAYLANTLIFFLVGMIVVELIVGKKADHWDFVYIFLIYVSINCIRAVVMIAFSPILKHIGYHLPWQSTIVASWSGLRGAVGLALALMVYETPDSKIPRMAVSYRVFLHLCGIVFLTLVINATTISKILALLGMSDISNARRAAMATSLSVLAEIKHKTMSVWMTDRFLSDVDWSFVDRLCSLQEPWDLTQDEDEEKKLRVWATCPNCEEDVPYQPTTREMQDLRVEAVLRLLKAQKLSYWRQFEHGMLSVVAVRTLQELCETAADVKGKYLDVEIIKKAWKTTTLTKVIEWVRKQDLVRSPARHRHSFVLPMLFRHSVTKRTTTMSLCKHFKSPHSMKGLLTSRWFVVAMAVGLYFLVDTTISVLHAIFFTQDSLEPLSDTLAFVSIGVWALMMLYAAVRLAVLGKAYVATCWFWLSLIIAVSGLVNVVLAVILHGPDEFSRSITEAQGKSIHFTMLGINMCRQLHALEALVPVIIMVLEKQEVQRLSDGYDIGRGYVMGEEEIRSRLDHMADRKDIIEELRAFCDTAKLDILKCLGLLQKDNPEVAMGVKTRQAIRSVLNNVREEIHVLLQDGLLEEAEGNELTGMVESRMKQLLTAPPRVPLPSIEKILQNVPWIADDQDLVRFIQSRAKLVNNEYGDVIMRQAEPTTGVSIILSGLVKLEKSVLVDRVDSADGEPIYTSRVLEFLTAGNVLGELGVLTGNPRSATVKCETGVQLLNISLEDIQLAFDEFQHLEPPLKYRLWRLSAIRLCTGIFLDEPAFQLMGMTKEKLRVRLENGYVEEIEKTPSTFPIVFHIGELVLLHGEARDSYSNKIYKGPVYIPQHVQLLIFDTYQCPNPALFILPTDNPPAHCRTSISLQPDATSQMSPGPGPSTFEDVARAAAVSLWGGPPPSSVKLTGSSTHALSTGVFKRMADKRGSIGHSLRRGSMFPSSGLLAPANRSLVVQRKTRASVTPFESMTMAPTPVVGPVASTCSSSNSQAKQEHVSSTFSLKSARQDPISRGVKEVSFPFHHSSSDSSLPKAASEPDGQSQAVGDANNDAPLQHSSSLTSLTGKPLVPFSLLVIKPSASGSTGSSGAAHPVSGMAAPPPTPEPESKSDTRQHPTSPGNRQHQSQPNSSFAGYESNRSEAVFRPLQQSNKVHPSEFYTAPSPDLSQKPGGQAVQKTGSLRSQKLKSESSFSLKEDPPDKQECSSIPKERAEPSTSQPSSAAPQTPLDPSALSQEQQQQPVSKQTAPVIELLNSTRKTLESEPTISEEGSITPDSIVSRDRLNHLNQMTHEMQQAKKLSIISEAKGAGCFHEPSEANINKPHSDISTKPDWKSQLQSMEASLQDWEEHLDLEIVVPTPPGQPEQSPQPAEAGKSDASAVQKATEKSNKHGQGHRMSGKRSRETNLDNDGKHVTKSGAEHKERSHPSDSAQNSVKHSAHIPVKKHHAGNQDEHHHHQSKQHHPHQHSLIKEISTETETSPSHSSRSGSLDYDQRGGSRLGHMESVVDPAPPVGNKKGSGVGEVGGALSSSVPAKVPEGTTTPLDRPGRAQTPPPEPQPQPQPQPQSPAPENILPRHPSTSADSHNSAAPALQKPAEKPQPKADLPGTPSPSDSPTLDSPTRSAPADPSDRPTSSVTREPHDGPRRRRKTSPGVDGGTQTKEDQVPSPGNRSVSS